MTQGGELAAHGASVDLAGKKLLNEVADLVAARAEQRTLALLEEAGKLPDVGRIGRKGEARQALLDLQIVEKSGNDAGVGFRGHTGSMRVIGHLGKCRGRCAKALDRKGPKKTNRRFPSLSLPRTRRLP